MQHRVPSTLMPVDQALDTLLSEVETLIETDVVSLSDALGRVLAQDQSSSIDVPPSNNSAMDGYAVCHNDLVRCGYELKVSQRIAAGYVGASLEKDTAARIFTGASIPENADTVIIQENCEPVLIDGNDAIRVGKTDIRCGQHIRLKGQDITVGGVLIDKGKRLQPQDIGFLASVGITQVPVYRRLKVAVISTGDELIEPGQPLCEGQIYNSNRYTLCALVSSLGCDVVDGGIVIDDFETTCLHFEALASKVDLVICSGGVSVGEEDHVKTAVEALGCLSLWKLNIKPGKPLAFGRINDTPFFGLPGNPSSVFVTFCLLARPFLLACQGQMNVEPLQLSVIADFESHSVGSRQEYLRAKVIQDPQGAKVQIYDNQSSGVLASVSWANALVVLPACTTVARGDFVKVIVLNELLH